VCGGECPLSPLFEGFGVRIFRVLLLYLRKEEIMISTVDQYLAINQGATYYYRDPGGYMRIDGVDRIDFLQRQSTNDLGDIKDGQTLFTVLTSPTARIIDMFQLMEERDSLFVVTLPGREVNTSEFLKRKIFFNDKVKITDLTEIYIQYLIEGVDSFSVIQELGFEPPLEVNDFISQTLDGSPIKVISEEGFQGQAYRLIFPFEIAGRIDAAIQELDVLPLLPETMNSLRVVAGKPGYKVELTEAYSPLEVKLEWAVSSKKGCYTGQEVIARQMAYDKVTKSLVGFSTSEIAAVGSDIFYEDRRVGRITSVTDLPIYGPLALGVVKRPFNKEETIVSISMVATENNGVVRGLPFNFLNKD
jgi:folate-binding protein YgfZ